MFYIGSASIDFQTRWNQHKRSLKRKTHKNILLQNSYNKNGPEVFVFEILEYVNCTDDILTIEQKYLDLYFDNQTNCYNICKLATKGPQKWSSESKKKRCGPGNPMYGRGIDRIGDKNPMFGKKISTKRKIEISKFFSGDHHPKSKLVDKDVIEILTKIKNGESANSLSKTYKVSRRTIRNIKDNISWKHIDRNKI